MQQSESEFEEDDLKIRFGVKIRIFLLNVTAQHKAGAASPRYAKTDSDLWTP